MKSSKVHFSKDTESENEATSMDPDLAAKLYEDGGFLIIKDFPEGAEFGIDMHSWNTGSKFLGVKMIPAGLHFIYYSPVSKEGSLAPRRGFFHNFTPGQIVIQKFDIQTEELLEDVSEEENARVRSNLKNVDGNLGPYPYQSWKKWVSLSNRITSTSLARLQPKCGPTISSSTEIAAPEKVEGLAVAPPDPDTCINFTRIARQKYPPGASPAEITRYSMDTSYQLGLFIALQDSIEEVLVELQFSFLCFLVGQNFDSFSQWKQLVAMLCGCGEALLKYPQLFLNFISDMHFQVKWRYFLVCTQIGCFRCKRFLRTSL